MSNEPSDPNAATTANDATHTDPTERDWFLQILVGMANDSGLEMGLTLLVGGAIVTGTLISHANYFKQLGGLFATATGSRDTAETIERFGDIATKSAEKDPSAPPPRFIHLRDGRIVSTSGKSIPTQGGVLWRGRVSEVDAFTVGTLGISQA